MAEGKRLDLVIIGGGPGGYVAAIRAAQLGLRTAVVEKDRLGGTCLHVGCIPTKALLRTAELARLMRRAGEFGLNISGDMHLDLTRAMERKAAVVDRQHKGVQGLMKRHHIEVLHGFGRIEREGRVVVQADEGEQTLECDHIIVATGSAPKMLPGLEADGEWIFTSDEILDIDFVPDSIAILGAGAVGVEFATMFSAFGSRVTLVEMLPRIVPLEDEDMSRQLARAFVQEGIDVRTKTKVQSVGIEQERVQITAEGSDGAVSKLDADALLVAVGRRPLTEGIGLETVGLQTERGFIRVDDHMRTAHPKVFAIGDVTGRWLLAHAASAQGVLAVEVIAGKSPPPWDDDRVPAGTFSHPEIGSVGLSEEKARARGHDVSVAKYLFRANGKAACLGEDLGIAKVVLDTRTGRVLGAHLIGPGATDIIAEVSLAVTMGATESDIGHTIHAHPTLPEVVKEATEAAAGHGIHS
jgi:dihydrolipoamide dehydrogenase